MCENTSQGWFPVLAGNNYEVDGKEVLCFFQSTDANLFSWSNSPYLKDLWSKTTIRKRLISSFCFLFSFLKWRLDSMAAITILWVPYGEFPIHRLMALSSRKYLNFPHALSFSFTLVANSWVKCCIFEHKIEVGSGLCVAKISEQCYMSFYKRTVATHFLGWKSVLGFSATCHKISSYYGGKPKFIINMHCGEAITTKTFQFIVVFFLCKEQK